MHELARFAGFYVAHGIWCVSDGEPLIPLAGYELQDGRRNLVRFADERLERGVEHGKAWLDENPEKALRCVLVYDGYVTLPTGKTDALLVDARAYGELSSGFSMAVPYRASAEPDGFAVFRPKYLALPESVGDVDALSDAFFAGVDSHEKGAAIWNARLDQSR